MNDSNITIQPSKHLNYPAELLLTLVKENKIDEIRNILSIESSPCKILNCSIDWAGDCLLAVSCWYERLEIAVMLVDEFHATINTVNSTGTTPLHRACSAGNSEMIRLLCGRGADLFARDISGRLPADYGTATVRQQIQEYIDVMSTLKIMEHDKEKEERRRNKLQRRCCQAVPISLSGAKLNRVNGIYDPNTDIIRGDWPTYHHRMYSQIVMHFSVTEDDIDGSNSSGEWRIEEEIQSAIASSSSSSPSQSQSSFLCYVRIQCAFPTFPELRLEGANGIIEYNFIKGSHKIIEGLSCIKIFPEDFPGNMNELEVLRSENSTVAESSDNFDDNEP